VTDKDAQDGFGREGAPHRQQERSTRRIADLYANDSEFRAAAPKREVIEAVRQPGLRLTQILQTFVEAYSDRPALGQRAREVGIDPATGRTKARLLPRFDTISYRDLWARVGAVATALSSDPDHPVRPGDFIATVGFASPEFLIIDLVCAYLGAVSIPLQCNAPVSRLAPILAEVEPRVLAVSVENLESAMESALTSAALRHLVVFDYRPENDDHRASIERAHERLHASGLPVTVRTVSEIIGRGAALPPVPIYTDGDDNRLALILYTSGSTGAPKGAMYTEHMLSGIWTARFTAVDYPVFTVNFMPLNHLSSRLPLSTAFQAGGVCYFVPESDMSTLFEDWALVRPTDMGLVPRVIDMLFQRYHSEVDRHLAGGSTQAEAEQAAATEIRENLLGGRVIGGLTTSASLSADMARFLDCVLKAHIRDGYGQTEVGPISVDGVVQRPPIIDYKLVDVPELGYFLTDNPYPRGELLVRTTAATPGYYKRPDVTAAVFDEHGYYRTGDVMAEIEPDRLVYVDRRNNVLKLSQGEFVAIANLEAVYAGAALVRQIFVYGNSERASLLAVVVPTPDALMRFGDDAAGLKSALSASLQQTAKAGELQSYELPVDFLVETQPFSADNGLLSGVGKLLRPKLMQHYGVRLEQMYTDIAAAQGDKLRELRATANVQPVTDTLTRAARIVLGAGEVNLDAQFTELGGDSLSALTFSNLLADIFDVEVPVGVIVSPANSLRELAQMVATQRDSVSWRPTSASVHGARVTELRATDLTLDKFVDAGTLAAARRGLPDAAPDPNTVLLTGANGWLGRFLALEWLQRLSDRGGTLITIVRGRDATEARARLEKAFDSGDPLLLKQFRDLATDRLEVLAGDIGEPDLGLNPVTWSRLADAVDLIVHPAALVNHLLTYNQLFGPNVVGTAELIRLAITKRLKPVTYLSTIAVARSVPEGGFHEDGDIRLICPARSLDDSYANGYANSKWAGEVLLREAHDLCGLPVAVFRSDMILAHTSYRGQVNVPDMFTRLLLSLIATGIAPKSFYETDDEGRRQRAHYDGLPVDFIAEAVTTLGLGADGYRSFDVVNPHDDGISLDVVVDWLCESGHRITRVDDYDDWFARFETALTALPKRQRQQSVLPLLPAYQKPERPLRGAVAPTEVFHAAVRLAGVDGEKNIPHITAELINKYVGDLDHLGLL
jgi:fatty acid CoA ligase FadD9